MPKGFHRRFPPLELLTDEQLRAIHGAVLDVLRETGVRFESEKALRICEENGCIVDHDQMRVRFPEALVEECIRRCPSSFRMKARNPENDLIMGGDTVLFANAPGQFTVDVDTWETREATMQEYYDYMTVLDALPNVHLLYPYPYFGFKGVPDVMRITEGVAAKFRNTSMWQCDANVSEADIWNIRIAQVLGTEIGGVMCCAAPLTYYGDQVEVALRAIEAGFPVVVVSGCVYGGTGPATIAGSVVTDTAEVLAGILFMQLIKPGARVWASDQTNPLNMRKGSPIFNNIASALHMAAGTQVYRSYGIPHAFACAGYTCSKLPDIQTGYERGMAALIEALAGSNIVGLHGGIYGECSAHPLLATIDDDIAGRIGRFLQGVTVDDETIALDLIEQVGPIPGSYLNTAHTRKWWDREQFIRRSADTLTYAEWTKSGKKSCLDYAGEVIEGILAHHKVSIPLTSGQEAEITRILNEAREYYRKKGLISDEEWKVYKEEVLKSPSYAFA